MLTALIGLAAGVVGGMGMGGGSILVPGLVLLLRAPQHVAQGIALATFLPMAAVALVVHYRNRNLRLRHLLPLVVGSAAGALLGALVAGRLNDRLLERLFAAFLLVAGLYEFFAPGPPGNREPAKHTYSERENN